MKDREQRKRNKKILILLLLLLLFLIAIILTVAFLKNDGKSEATISDKISSNYVNNQNSNEEEVNNTEENKEITNTITSTNSTNDTNSTIVNPKVDKTAPEVTGVENGAYYKEDVTPIIKDDSEITATLDGKPYTSGTPITGEGEHTLIVTDKAGNETKISFTIDKTAPKITGVEDGAYYKEDVTPNAEDATELTAKLNGEDYILGTPITQEGEYTLVVTDKAGNETKVSFTIDKTAPEVIGVENGVYYKEDVTATINDFTEVVATLNGKPYTSGTQITEEGEHTLIVTDKAGNETKVSFTIDKTAPEITGVENGAYYKEDVTPNAQDATELTAKLDGEDYILGTSITQEGEHTLIVTDKAGNEAKVSFTIDKTAPEVTGVENGVYYKENVTATINDATEVVATLNGNPYTSGTQIIEEGEHTLIVTDKAGNETKVSFTIDKTAPEVIGVENGVYYKEDVTATINDFTEVVATLNGKPYTSGTQITEEGEHTLIVTDKAGNETKVSFTIDKTAPKITGVENEAYYKEDVTPNAEDATELTAKLNGEDYISGTPITQEGEYTLVVTDKAGNETKVSFTIDKTAPEINIAENVIVILGDEFVEDIYDKISDMYTAKEDLDVKIEKEVFDIETVGKYPITYIVTDKAGNSNTKTRVVEVKVAYATFIEGPTFNEKIKKLSQNIVTIERSSTEPKIESFIEVQTADSITPIKIWLDEEDNTKVLWYSRAEKPKLNSNSSEMFYKLTELTSQDITNICDTNNVTDMHGMFGFCYNLTELNVNNFDTSNVENMNEMFTCCDNLTQLDLSNFDTSKVTDMDYMFAECTNLTTIYTSNKFVVNQVKNQAHMFNNSIKLQGGNGTTYDNLHIDKQYAKIDTPKTPGYFTTLTQHAMFETGITFNSKIKKLYKDNIATIERPDTEEPLPQDNIVTIERSSTEPTTESFIEIQTTDSTNSIKMWVDKNDYTKILWYTKVERPKLNNNSGNMFNGLTNLTSQDITNICDTSKVTNMSYMFKDCSKLSELDLSKLDTSNVTDMNGMFYRM